MNWDRVRVMTCAHRHARSAVWSPGGPVRSGPSTPPRGR